MMPPRTAKVGRSFPTFKIRNSIACGYSPGSAPFPRKGKARIRVSHRQVRVHRRHGQDLLPFP